MKTIINNQNKKNVMQTAHCLPAPLTQCPPPPLLPIAAITASTVSRRHLHSSPNASDHCRLLRTGSVVTANRS